jgi:hypothetical protein
MPAAVQQHANGFVYVSSLMVNAVVKVRKWVLCDPVSSKFSSTFCLPCAKLNTHVKLLFRLINIFGRANQAKSSSRRLNGTCTPVCPAPLSTCTVVTHNPFDHEMKNGK